MPLVTYGYHTTPAMPDSVELDDGTYDRIERLPRNLKPGDLLLIGDNTDWRQYHQTFVTITNVDTYPTTYKGWRRYGPQCRITFRLAEGASWRWRSWGNPVTFYESETKEPVTWAYRKRVTK